VVVLIQEKVPNVLDSPFEEGVPGLIHEILGHALDDFLKPDSNYQMLSLSPDNPFREYFIWKLQKTFSPGEIKHFRRLLEKSESEHLSESERRKVESKLAPYLEKVREKFSSLYAMQGTEGILYQIEFPAEDVAVLMENFYKGLQEPVFVEFKDPLFKLIGLYHLMNEYGVSKLGGIKKEEIFSRKAFKEVLGIDLDGMKEMIPPYEIALAGNATRRGMARRYSRGTHLNLGIGTHWFFDDPVPNLATGIELEFGEKDRSPITGPCFIVPGHYGFPHINYSIFGIGDEPVDILTLGARYFNPSPIALEIGGGVGNLLFNGENNRSVGFAGNIGARVGFEFLGSDFNFGPTFGYVARGDLKDSFYGGLLLGLP
jgi:hypothetical protein